MPFCIEDRAYLVRRAPVVCFSPHRSLNEEKSKEALRNHLWFLSALMPTRQIHVPWVSDNYNNLINGWHLLYVRRDVIFCPLLSECEQVVEALQRVLWEILHPQQGDGLWTGGAVHQGDALKDFQHSSTAFSFSREVSRNEQRETAAASGAFITRAWLHEAGLRLQLTMTQLRSETVTCTLVVDSWLRRYRLTFSWSSLVLMPSGTLCCQTSWNSLRLNLTAFCSSSSATPRHTLSSCSA